MEQTILSIGREFGSAGHEIAQKLADYYQLPLYDHNLLDEIAASKGLDSRELQGHDEVRRNRLFNRNVRGMDSSPAYNLALLQFDFLREKAESGESFVVVGRCSETILKGNEGFVSIFVLGDWEAKRERIMRLYNLSPEEAEHMMSRKDWERKSYHNYYCKGKWGDSRNYDLSINSSRLGVEGTVDLLETYIRARMDA